MNVAVISFAAFGDCSNCIGLFSMEKKLFGWQRIPSFGTETCTICTADDGNGASDADSDDDDAIDDSDSESDDNNEDDDGECNKDGAMENSHELYGELVMLFIRY